MKLKLFLKNGYNKLDGGPIQIEPPSNFIKFYRNKYTEYNFKKTIFVFAFVEFGSEFFYPLHFLPRIKKYNPEHKIVLVGWKNRSFLYRHLVDEYWELHEQFMHLRDSSRAMRHESRLINKLEWYLQKYGIVIKSEFVGNSLVEFKCFACEHRQATTKKLEKCPSCGGNKIKESLLSELEKFKSEMINLPALSEDSINWAKKEIPENAVAVFARSRMAYGRNLDCGFYKKLFELLKSLGYYPILLGEKNSSLNCGFSEICDYLNLDLELVLAILQRCKFSVQFWTGSTRLSQMVKTPFLLIESPDQIYGKGQEGVRIDVFSKSDQKSKIVLSNYYKFVENYEQSIDLIKKAILEMESENFNDIIGLVDNFDYVLGIKNAR